MTATSPFHLDGGEPFSYREGVLHVGGLPVDQLAGATGTPLYPVSYTHLTLPTNREV